MTVFWHESRRASSGIHPGAVLNFTPERLTKFSFWSPSMKQQLNGSFARTGLIPDNLFTDHGSGAQSKGIAWFCLHCKQGTTILKGESSKSAHTENADRESLLFHIV